MSEEVRYVVLPKAVMDEVNAYSCNTEYSFGFSIVYRSLDFEGLHNKYNVFSDQVLVQVSDPKRFDKFYYSNRQLIRFHEAQKDITPRYTDY